MRRRVRQVLADHWPVAVVFVLAAVARVVVAIAYRPALFFTDSWGYVKAAYGPTHLGGVRPPGYGLSLWLMDATVGRSLALVTTVQHVGGLAVGLLAYLLLTRLGAARLIATTAAALLLLDSYAITLEQTMLAETFTTTALAASVFLLVTARSPLLLALSGLLLAGAVVTRTPCVFVVPVWLLYALHRHRAPLPRLAAAGSMLAAIAAFMAITSAKTGQFGLSNADGWFLYGRVAGIADCREFTPPEGTEGLCEPPGHPRRSPVYYVWDPASPAWQRYGSMGAKGSDGPLRAFALATVRTQPLEYLELVAGDLAKYAAPWEATPGGSDAAVTLPQRPRTEPGWLDVPTRDAYLPGYQPEIHAPSSVARVYGLVARFPRPLVVILVALPLALLATRRGGHRAEVLLLSGAGLALVIGATGTSAFVVRYLIPALPLLITGASLSLAELLALRPTKRAVHATSAR